MSGNGDKAILPDRTTNTVVVLTETCGEDRDFVQLNSVRYEARLTAVLDEALASKAINEI